MSCRTQGLPYYISDLAVHLENYLLPYQGQSGSSSGQFDVSVLDNMAIKY